MLDMPPQMSLLSRIHLQTDGQQWVLSEPQRIFSAERSQIMNLPQPLNGGANIPEDFRRRFVCAIVCVCHRLRVRGRVCVCVRVRSTVKPLTALLLVSFVVFS